MKAGKLPGVVENRSVFMFTGTQRLEPAQNVCSVAVGGQITVLATDQTGIFGTEQTRALRIGVLFDRVYAMLVAQGADGGAFTVSLSLPPKAEERELKKLSAMIAQAAESRGITAYSVHVQGRYEPEECAGIVQMTVTGAGVKGAKALPPVLVNAPAGKSIVMAGYAALEATAVLISEKQDVLSKRLAVSYLTQGLKKICQTDMQRAARIAADAGAVVKIAGEGGVFGALWELGEYFDCGMDIALRDILMLQETIEVCEVLDVNPYMLASGGCILAVTEDAKALLAQYQEAGIAAAEIGTLKEGRDRVIHNEWEERFLEPFRAEEMYRVL
ncbi:MAG: hypothetical protein K2O03_02000 [Lachnospiraceae bacterium]|nr:hypothetical protein [Lachnospiraceae bacterium]